MEDHVVEQPSTSKPNVSLPDRPETQSVNIANEKTPLLDEAKKASKKLFYKNIKILNPGEVDRNELVASMRERYRRKSKRWEKKATKYSRCAFVMTFLILVLQVGQMVLLPMKDLLIPDEYFTVATAVVAAASALLAGLQLKLKMNEKVEKLRDGIKKYNELSRAGAYYQMMSENGGVAKDDDTIIFWKFALKTEVEDIPFIRTMNSV